MNLNSTFISEDNLLSYSCEMPILKNKKTGILFVHAANSTRLGPHRMYVEMARHYQNMCFPTFRFDMRGCGDSAGQYNEYQIEPDIIDTLAAIRKFIDYAKLDQVILVGISKGARVCYNIMSKYHIPLAGMILLSASVMNNKNGMKYSFEQLKIYKRKLFQLSTIRKILSGKINIKQICKTLYSPIFISHNQNTKTDNYIYSKCPILLIYGDKDPIFKNSYEYYTKELKKNNITHKCHIIPGANHSFYHYKWKEEIIRVSDEWLKQFNEKVPQCLR